MARVLVLYYSTYGNLERMAEAMAEGARSEGAEVAVKRVPELLSAEQMRAMGAKADSAPVADPGELADYDAIVVGTPTRYGRMATQMAHFWDQTGGLWSRGALVGKVGGAFTSAATKHGGLEVTLLALHTVLLHHGMVVVGLPYPAPGEVKPEEVAGMSPCGATTVAGARYQGAHVARIAERLARRG
jgi:NAD(P)H dehydrogenase (quinone)